MKELDETSRSEALKERQKAAMRERYRFLREQGICYCCGRQDAVIFGRCEDCYRKQNEYQHKFAETHREELRKYQADWQRSRSEVGICKRCGRRPAEPGKRKYELCLIKTTLDERVRNIAKRLEQFGGYKMTDESIWKHIHFLTNQLPEMRFQIERARSAAVRKNVNISFSYRHSNTPQNRTEQAVKILDEAKDAYARLKAELDACRAEAANAIQKIPDPTIRRAMELRWLQGKSARAIAWDMAYSERHVYRLLRAGERMVMENEQSAIKQKKEGLQDGT